MDTDTTFGINEPGVISEVIEGEAIILNFESGTYYSLNDSFQHLWQGIAQGLSLSGLESLLRAHYPEAVDRLGEHITAAVQQLVEEQLIVVSGARPASLVEPVVQNQAYEPPLLQKYTDLQELLLLDPIHDVDESGQAISKE